MASQSSAPQQVHFSVAQAETEAAKKAEEVGPFRIDVGGRTIEMINARRLDWKVLASLESPAQFLRHCVSEQDRLFLREQKIAGDVFNDMIKAYRRHFGLENLNTENDDLL